MADLSTSYMGINLSSPVVVGACTLSRKIDNFKKAEDAGAGAMVVYSLFQEQIELEEEEFEEALAYGSDHYAESLTYLPHMPSTGSREHVVWVEKTRKEVAFPIFGSVNATSKGAWADYAKELESAGCDALEINLYSVEANPNVTAAEVEERFLDTVREVASRVAIPVAVKLSPWHTAMANFARRVADAGASGIVLFNRFYRPSIDPWKETLEISLDLSRPEDTRLPLRWNAILSGNLAADLAASTGVHSGMDVVRHLLAGAKAAQAVSALYKHGIGYVTEMNDEISRWMIEKGYSSIEDFRGKLDQKHIADPLAFERAQYIKLLLGKEPASLGRGRGAENV